MLERIGVGEPVRLFVGGLHGREGIITKHVLEDVSRKVENDSLILCNLSIKSKYISTLDPKYYQIRSGKHLLLLIRKYRHEIYIELHSYQRKYCSNLTASDRTKERGVPPLVDLEDGILLGSVSPVIRTTEFKKNDLCLSLDIPTDINDLQKIVNILNTATSSCNRFEFLEKFRKAYPTQIQIA
jgi:hypothetical protein